MHRHENREIRGRILKILDTSYPLPSGDRLISQILSDVQYNCSPPQVKVHLAYMEEKGYVELEEVEVAGLGARCLAKLTARGKDLLEGNIDADPGVDLNG